MKLQDLIKEIEKFAPLVYQESYDNCGLLVGNKELDVSGILLCLDCTEAIIDEAVKKKCNVVIAHHPIIFGGIKKINGNNYVERTIIKSIKNDVAIYACHTNLDNVKLGVNKKIADKLGLVNQRILAPKKGLLKKIVTYVPETHLKQVREALFSAGAGNIGNYSQCSFTNPGVGTFMPNEFSNPFSGKKNELTEGSEQRLELVFEVNNQNQVLSALRVAHPYEEIAFEIISIENESQNIGSGMVGELPEELLEQEFLNKLKTIFNLKTVKHTSILGKKIKTVSLCGGSGSFLLKNAINCNSDAYVSSDFKYHEFFDAENKILVADIGHYESEQFTPEIFYDIISNKFPNFATYLSEINTNPVDYF